MTRRLLLVAAAMVLAAPAPAQTPPPMISVSGTATLSVAPDQAQVEAGVSSHARTARDASEANNAAMSKVLLALKAANIDEKDIQTSRLSLQPESAPNRAGGADTITGYRASNQVTVRLREISRVAGVIDILTGAGANEIGGIDFMVANASKLLDEARAQAIADARRKAEIYAKAAGVTLGEPLSITEEGSPGPSFRTRVASAGLPMTKTPVAEGEETLQVNVSVSWTIKPGQ